MIPFDPERVLANVRKSSTADLLNRVTAYRAGMEPEAIRIIEQELHSRGISQAEILEYQRRVTSEILTDEAGIALKCSFCHNPAVHAGWGWHRLFGKLPLFPRKFRYCREHRPGAHVLSTSENGDGTASDISSHEKRG